jgi:hypothetical protein
MEKVREISPQRLEIRSGGGYMSVFGLPFFAAGVFVTLMAVGVIVPVNAGRIPLWGLPVMAFMGLVFVAVGGGLAFGRRWKVLDRSRGLITVDIGLLVPMKSTEYGLYDYDAVVLSHQPGDSDTSESYPVALQGIGSTREFKIIRPASYAESRAEAEKIAKFLRLPLVDRSTPHESVLETEAAQRSFGRRNGSRNAVERPVPPPSVLQSAVQESADGVIITIPGRLGTAGIIQFLIPIAFALFVVFNVAPLFGATDTPEFVSVMFFAVALLFFVIPLIRALWGVFDAKTKSTVVSAGAQGVEIEERHAFRKRSTRIPPDAIIDIDFSTSRTVVEGAEGAGEHSAPSGNGSSRWREGQVVAAPSWLKKIVRLFPAKGIFIKAHTGIYSFGAGLPDNEVRYLHDIVTRALSRGSQRDGTGNVPVSDIIGASSW